MKYKLLSTAIAATFLTACGGGGSDSQPPVQIEENAPPIISVQQNVTISENSSSSIDFTVSDPENDPTQVSLENTNNSFSVETQGNQILITANEVSSNIEGSFFIVASDAKNTTRQEVSVNVVDTNEPSTITFPEQITLNEDPSKTFELIIEDVDSSNLSVSFDYDKSSFDIEYDIRTSELIIDYVGINISETIRRQFDIVVTDGVNEVVKNVFVTVYPTNDNPVIVFDQDVVISEGGRKYYKLLVNDDNIGEVSYQFNTEINGLNINFVDNNTQEGFSNGEYSEYLIIDASGANISTNISSFIEIVVKDTFEGLDEIIETKRINLTLLDKLSTDSIEFNDNTDVGTAIPTLTNKDSFRFTTDLMKHSNNWTTHCFSDECSRVGNTNESVNLDENGWVKTLPAVEDPEQYTHVKTKVFDNSNESRKTTRFYVIWEGEGKITYDIQGQKNISLSQPFMDVIDLDSYTSQLTLNIEAIGDNYIKNVKVIPDAGYCDNFYTFSLPEDCSGNFVHFVDSYHYFDFHPDLINVLKDYKVLNLSNNLVINDNSYVPINGFFFDKEEQKSWVDNTHGVPFSRLIQLANYINADIALDIPVNSNLSVFSDTFISHLSEFNGWSYISYGNINDDFSISDFDVQNLINEYNSDLVSFESKIVNNRRQILIDEVNNNPDLTEDERLALISDINNQEMVSTEEKVLNMIVKNTREYCDYILDNSSINFHCDVKGSFNDNVLTVMEDSYNQTILNCDIYREYLKTQPDTSDNITYWENNNCDEFFENLIVEPVLGDYIAFDNMQTIGSWDDDSDSALYRNFEIELFEDSTFEDSTQGAVEVFNLNLADVLVNTNEYEIGISSRNFRHNYYVEGESSDTISDWRRNIITMNTNIESNVWKKAYFEIMQTWIEAGGRDLILYNYVESNEDNGVRALKSNEDQETQMNDAVNEIFNTYGCWHCR